MRHYIFPYQKSHKKAGKAYPPVCPQIVKNDERSRKDLESYVQYMKANKFIVEHDETNPMPAAPSTTSGTATTFG